MSSQDFSELDPDQAPQRNRRALRADRRNLQALAIAAVPIVVLLAVVILGIMLVRGRSGGGTPAATATLLPTARPTVLVAVQTTEATATTAPATPTIAPTTAAATQAPTDTPAAAEPTASPTPSDELVAGAVAVVSDTAGRGLNMRSEASINAIAIKVLQEGAEVTIIGGPTEADDFTWFQVRDSANAEGWVASDWLVRVR